MSEEMRLKELLFAWCESEGTIDATELCRDCPDLLEELRKTIRFVNHMDHLVDSSSDYIPSRGDRDYQNAKTLPLPWAPSSNLGNWNPPSISTELAGYKLVEELGRGGNAIVYKAEKHGPRGVIGKFAIKLVRPDVVGLSDAGDAFAKEARAMTEIVNDNVVRIWDYNEEDRHQFIVMELLAGETLAKRIEREGILPNDEIVRIGTETANGLIAIHAKTLIHRDLKPSNIWLEQGTGRVKILDLGLVHESGSVSDSISGTPAYMSPEQFSNNEQLNTKSDLFSLGTVLYECSTGKSPFRKEDPLATACAICKDTPAHPKVINPGISDGLEELILDLLDKDPDRRPASAREVLRRFETLAKLVVGPSRHVMFPSNWLLAWVISAVLLVFGWAGWTYLNGNSTEPRVKSLEVMHYAAINSKTTESRGVIGKDSFRIYLDDEIKVRVTLNRPAYCYIILFRPDGKDVVLYPQDETDLPEFTDMPVYPAKRRGESYVLEEAEMPGLWMVATFVSRSPLPSYKEWRNTQSAPPWKEVPIPDRERISTYDGFLLETVDQQGNRGSRKSRENSIVIDVVEWMKEKGASNTAAIAFPVEDKQP